MQTEYERKMRQTIQLLDEAKKYCFKLGILFILVGAGWFIAAHVYRSVCVIWGRKRKKNKKKARKRIKTVLIGLVIGAAAGIHGFCPVLAQGDEQSPDRTLYEQPVSSPYIIEGFQILADGDLSYYEGTPCTNEAVEAVLVFFCHDPDPESIQVRMIPRDTRARRSVENSEYGDRDGGISLPGYRILQTEEDIYEIRIRFFEEGKWKAVFYCEDRMGNALQGVRDGDSEDFVIDLESPLLEVSYDKIIRITEKVCGAGAVNQDFRTDLPRMESSDGEVFFDPGKARVIIRVEDDTFDPDRMKLEILRNDSGADEKEGENAKAASPGDFTYVKEWEKIAENTYRTIIDFREEGHYRVRIKGTDAAGHSLRAEDESETEACLEEGAYRSPLLTVDRTLPRIWCETADRLEDESPAVRIRVREDHFHPRFLQLEDRILDADDEIIDSLSLKDYRMEWKVREDKEGIIYESMLSLRQEGRHELKLSVIDGAGQESHAAELTAVYDISPPEIIYKDLDSASGDILFLAAGEGGHEEPAIWFPYSSFAYFHQKKIRVRISASDRVSGTARLVCHIRGSGRKSRGKGIIDPPEEVDEELVIMDENREGGKKKLTGYVEVPADNFKGSLSVYAVDYRGNIGKEIHCRGMISESADLHEQSSAIRYALPKPDGKDDEKGVLYYRGDVQVKAGYHDDYSGVSLCRLSACSGSRVIDQKEKDMGAEKDLQAETALFLTLRADDYADSAPEKPALLKAWFRDNAGNETDKAYDEKRIVIDAAAPVIEVSYDHKDAVSGSCYGKERTALVKVRDCNFDEEGVLWDIQGKKDGYTISPWEKKEDYYQCTVHFHDDGKDYKLKLTVADHAGNTSTWDEDQAFTIDTVPPRILLSMDRKDVKNERYYNKDKLIQIRIQDDNPDPEQLVWKISGKNDGKSLRVRIPEVRWQGEDQLVCRLHLTHDGDYSIGLECTDLAGHRTECPQEQFTIDQEKPKLEIRGVRDGCTYTNRVAPSVMISDLHPDFDRTEIRIVKIGIGEISDKEAYHNQRNSGRKQIGSVWGDFDHIPEADGVYKIYVDAEDLAGNPAAGKKECLFYVNRFGSVYVLNDDTRQKLESYYMKEEADIHITEYSVNPVRSRLVLICDNEERKELSQASDYRRVEESLPGLSGNQAGFDSSSYAGWKRYDYYISKDNFSVEGSYQLRIESDGVGMDENKQETLIRTDNEKKKLPLSFVIDKTPPEIVLSGLEKTGYREESHKISFTAIDNQKLDRLRISFYRGWFFQDKESLTLHEEDLDRMHRWQTELKADHSLQKVCYEAWDQAGNYISSDEKGKSKICLIQAPAGAGPVERAAEAIEAVEAAGVLQIPGMIWAGLAVFLTALLAGILVIRRRRRL